MEKRFYNAKEISVYLGVSEEAVRKWSLRGQIPFVKLGKSLRFDMIKIDSWVKTKEDPYARKQFN
ncbi:MAG: helix-turn-helix domain-containing protein [Candidatus Omnitrophica bacterium]|nr:helix-turn-helix domain-containing protein [Candidatus Omnitrophota bacterium]MDE2009884.1 helix-turn-helix domain-containing protein [Candidatus Omnitrophota bacterium]MDE2214334.1 helix-turn-helix domain-containing protein [Candidatus Omnitrophota bacterium]MDE2231083.1 helix-turn-helix domain-containing protein [Candidatus Omnitrophota bacterium]